MGTIRFVTTADGTDVGLYDHAGYVGHVFDDGTVHAGGTIGTVDRHTVAFLAACECGWRGTTVVQRASGQSAWPDWEDVPELENEWTAHTDPHLDALRRSRAAEAEPEPQPDNTADTTQTWSLVDGDIHLPAEEAEWWGATLSILVAAIHQPDLLASQQPHTDSAQIAEQVLDELDILWEAVAAVDAEPQPDPEPVGTSVVTGRDSATGRYVVISPGTELRPLAWLLEAFARGVLDPDKHSAAVESANGHVASAWSRELGVAAGVIR